MAQPATAADTGPVTGRRHLAYMRLPDLIPADANPKLHDSAGITRSVFGVEDDHVAGFGFTEPPMLDERTGRLVAGHGRRDALIEAKEAGKAPPDGIGVADDGEWLVPVVRGWASTSDSHTRAYLAASNKLVELGGWDFDALTGYLTDIDAAGMLAITGFTGDDLSELLANIAGGTGDDDMTGGDIRDRSAAIPDDPVTVEGDMWVLGEHRLLCGSATDPNHVDRLLAEFDRPPGIVYTDPPYGISVVKPDNTIGGGGPGPAGSIGNKISTPLSRTLGGKPGGKIIPTTIFPHVIGDNSTDTARDAFTLLMALLPGAAHVWWGANHYTAVGIPNARCWLVWDKVNGHTDFADCELAWTNHRGSVRMLRHQWSGMIRASERGKGQRVHPTQKPVALAEWAFTVIDEHHERDLVLDVFAGSGSTLIAADATDRACAAMELSPGYCDVVCRRYQRETGALPVRDGQPHDFAPDDDEGDDDDDES